MAEAELTTVARPYARAVFAHALASGTGLDDWSATLSLLAGVVTDAGVRQALDNPALTRGRRMELLLELVSDQLSQEGRNFVTILAEQGRVDLLPQIASLYELMKRNHLKRVEVELTSAYEVDEADREKIRRALAASLQREITIESTVDPALVGGAIVRTGDTVIDYSVRGKLTRLGHELNS